MRHICLIPFIILLTCSILILQGKPATGTTYPIPDDSKQRHIYNDELADKGFFLVFLSMRRNHSHLGWRWRGVDAPVFGEVMQQGGRALRRGDQLMVT